MRASLSVSLVALLCLSGCNMYKLGLFNAINEPINCLDTNKTEKKAVALAQDAWLEHLSHIPENCPPQPFETGFIHGYADYLLRGGNGAPPAIPPNAFRRTRSTNPEGHLAIQAYYTGFAVGADAAKRSGLRAMFLFPISSPLTPAERYNDAEAGREVEQTFPPPETLPAPKPLDNKGDAEDPKKGPPELEPKRELPPEPNPPKGKEMMKGNDPATPEVPVLPAPQPARVADPFRPAARPREAPPEYEPIGPPVGSPLPREFSLPIQGGPAAR